MNEREDIKAYLDGELTPEQAALVERLLAEDPSAANEAEQFRQIGESVRALARAHQPRGLDHAVAKVARPRRLLFPVAGAVAAVVLLGIVGPKITGNGLVPAADAGVAATPAPDSEDSATESLRDGSSLTKEDKREAPNSSRAAPSGEEAMAGIPASDSQPGRPFKAPDSSPPVLNAQRDVIRNADVSVTVQNASSALAELLRSTEALGGYFEQSSLTVDQENPVANATLRVPSERFEAAVSMVRGLGTVLRENISGQDVTAQIVDYGARARVLANEEQSLIAMLREARSTGAILEIRQRLGQVRAELESYNSQLKSLQNLSSLSTITVELRQDLNAGSELAPEDWFGKTMAVAVSSLSAVTKIVVQGLIYVVVLAPVWIPLALLGRWAMKRQTKP